MLSVILTAVAMEWWECILLCVCGIVIGWEARGVLQVGASRSETELPSSGWASVMATFWDPQKIDVGYFNLGA